MSDLNLTASLVVHNELSRYLHPCIEGLLEFCDAIFVLDDHSTDGTYEWLMEHPCAEVIVVKNGKGRFYDHEGELRQRLLSLTLATQPTHILAVDADEFIADGRMLRQSLKNMPMQEVWTLQMQEVWKADENALWIRADGGWRAHETTCLYRVPAQLPVDFGIANKQLASGREPVYVQHRYRASVRTGTDILHFGWANEHERRARYTRYEVADGGRFHTSNHLQSILDPDDRVRLNRHEWPASLLMRQADMLERIRQPR